MRVFGFQGALYHLPRDFQLSPEAKRRLAWLDFYSSHDRNARLTCRHFALSSRTFYKWLHRFNPRNLASLEDRSRKPHRLRSSPIPQTTVDKVVALRKEFPAWSKYKLAVLLKSRHGLSLSPSTLGRIIARYHLFLPKTRKKHLRRLHRQRLRAPQTLYQAAPGSLLQFDTKHLRFSDGAKVYQFTAVDTCTRLRVLRAYSTASSKSAQLFLAEVQAAFPFPIQNLNTDNGSEFLGAFDKACANSIPHFFSYPHCPKHNGLIERSHKTDDDEFYHLLEEEPQSVAELNLKLQAWERTFNTIRPHAALGYLTPAAYFANLAKQDPKRPAKVFTMY